MKISYIIFFLLISINVIIANDKIHLLNQVKILEHQKAHRGQYYLLGQYLSENNDFDLARKRANLSKNINDEYYFDFVNAFEIFKIKRPQNSNELANEDEEFLLETINVCEEKISSNEINLIEIGEILAIAKDILAVTEMQRAYDFVFKVIEKQYNETKRNYTFNEFKYASDLKEKFTSQFGINANVPKSIEEISTGYNQLCLAKDCINNREYENVSSVFGAKYKNIIEVDELLEKAQKFLDAVTFLKKGEIILANTAYEEIYKDMKTDKTFSQFYYEEFFHHANELLNEREYDVALQIFNSIRHNYLLFCPLRTPSIGCRADMEARKLATTQEKYLRASKQLEESHIWLTKEDTDLYNSKGLESSFIDDIERNFEEVNSIIPNYRDVEQQMENISKLRQQMVSLPDEIEIFCWEKDLSSDEVEQRFNNFWSKERIIRKISPNTNLYANDLQRLQKVHSNIINTHNDLEKLCSPDSSTDVFKCKEINYVINRDIGYLERRWQLDCLNLKGLEQKRQDIETELEKLENRKVNYEIVNSAILDAKNYCVLKVDKEMSECDEQLEIIESNIDLLKGDTQFDNLKSEQQKFKKIRDHHKSAQQIHKTHEKVQKECIDSSSNPVACNNHKNEVVNLFDEDDYDGDYKEFVEKKREIISIIDTLTTLQGTYEQIQIACSNIEKLCKLNRTADINLVKTEIGKVEELFKDVDRQDSRYDEAKKSVENVKQQFEKLEIFVNAFNEIEDCRKQQFVKTDDNSKNCDVHSKINEFIQKYSPVNQTDMLLWQVYLNNQNNKGLLSILDELTAIRKQRFPNGIADGKNDINDLKFLTDLFSFYFVYLMRFYGDINKHVEEVLDIINSGVHLANSLKEEMGNKLLVFVYNIQAIAFIHTIDEQFKLVLDQYSEKSCDWGFLNQLDFTLLEHSCNALNELLSFNKNDKALFYEYLNYNKDNYLTWEEYWGEINRKYENLKNFFLRTKTAVSDNDYDEVLLVCDDFKNDFNEISIPGECLLDIVENTHVKRIEQSCSKSANLTFDSCEKSVEDFENLANDLAKRCNSKNCNNEKMGEHINLAKSLRNDSQDFHNLLSDANVEMDLYELTFLSIGKAPKSEIRKTEEKIKKVEILNSKYPNNVDILMRLLYLRLLEKKQENKSPGEIIDGGIPLLRLIYELSADSGNINFVYDLFTMIDVLFSLIGVSQLNSYYLLDKEIFTHEEIVLQFQKTQTLIDEIFEFLDGNIQSDSLRKNAGYYHKTQTYQNYDIMLKRIRRSSDLTLCNKTDYLKQVTDPYVKLVAEYVDVLKTHRETVLEGPAEGYDVNRKMTHRGMELIIELFDESYEALVTIKELFNGENSSDLVATFNNYNSSIVDYIPPLWYKCSIINNFSEESFYQMLDDYLLEAKNIKETKGDNYKKVWGDKYYEMCYRLEDKECVIKRFKYWLEIIRSKYEESKELKQAFCSWLEDLMDKIECIESLDNYSFFEVEMHLNRIKIAEMCPNCELTPDKKKIILDRLELK